MTPDRRSELRGHTDHVYTMPKYESAVEWSARAEQLRKRLLLGSGLFPLPERTPLNARILGRIQHEDYSVEKVYFESRPGFYCTGNLYRPTGRPPFPAVLCPHGHWPRGRVEDIPRGSIPARCITLARMGAVVFSYDMIGYCDSVQFPHNWGGKEERLWGIHSFGFQLWTSIRALDFLESLDDVDAARIGVTGASGGATQTFALYAVDDRVAVAAPVNMISRSMQGGCLCENGPLLRLDNSNVELGATMAPKPLLMVSTSGDWTAETPRQEFPAIREIYALFGAADRIENRHFDYEHNYNLDSRNAVYRFFGKWLFRDEDRLRDFTEPPYEVEHEQDLRAAIPANAPAADALISETTQSSRAKWARMWPQSARDLPAFQAEARAAFATVLDATIPGANEITAEQLGRTSSDSYVFERWMLGRPAKGETVPAWIYVPRAAAPVDAVLLVHGDGKSHLADPEGGPGPLVSRLLSAGLAVALIDVYLTGEHQARYDELVIDRPNEDLYMNGGIFYIDDTFRPTPTACRVQDILTAAAWLRGRGDATGIVALAGLRDAGLPCLFAVALDTRIGKVWVDANGFNRDDDVEWACHFYVPAIRSIGDIATACLLVSPRPLHIANTGERFATADLSRLLDTVDSNRLATSEAMPNEEYIVAFIANEHKQHSIRPIRPITEIHP